MSRVFASKEACLLVQSCIKKNCTFYVVSELVDKENLKTGFKSHVSIPETYSSITFCLASQATFFMPSHVMIQPIGTLIKRSTCVTICLPLVLSIIVFFIESNTNLCMKQIIP